MTARQRIAAVRGYSPALKFVLMVGIMSFFADFTYEGSRSITGPYLGLLGAGAFTISVVSGAGEFLGYNIRLFSGRGADRTGKYWPITIGGYILQMSVVPLLALAGNWQVAAVLIIAERIGKGIRNPPRDAMLSHAAKDIGYGRAFGVHEALDQFGAMFGPLLVALVLVVGHHDYKVAFAVLAVPAAIMLSLLGVARVLYPRPQDLAAGPAPAAGDGLPRVFWIYAGAAALAAAGFADFPLIAYHFQHAGTVSATLTPVFYAVAMAVSGAGSLIMGKVFDRAGIGVLVPLTIVAALYAPLVFLGGFWAILAGACLWGLGMGVQESLIPAAVAPMVSPDRRAFAYGLFTGIYGTAWVAGSIVIGVLVSVSLGGLVAFCVASELAAIPLILIVRARTRPASGPGLSRPFPAGGEMDELRTYADRRLELGDMIRAALHLARGSGDEQAEKRARDLLSRLAADTFQLAVAGQFSRGKTTLMNALLGGPYLPMGALPMTSVITTVRYGSRPKAIVRRRGSGLAAEVPLAQVAGYIAQASATRAEQQVVSVEVEVPAEILRLGFEFIDTPGVGSAIEVNTETTRRFLPQADAVIFVTGFDSPLTQAEAGFLADAARHAGKLFLVLNKRDLVSGQDADAALEFVRHRLREDMSMVRPRIFTLSALEALEAVVAGDDGRLVGSGLPDLHAELREFLTASKTRLFLRNIAGHAARLVARQRLERASREVISGWLERRTGEVLEMVTATVAGEIGSLLKLARSPGMVGAEIAGLAGEDDRGELAGWSAEDVPDLAIRRPAWTVQVEQPRRSRRRVGPGDAEVRDRLGAALAAAVGAFTDHARTAFADAAREWARRLDEQAARQMRQAADWFRQCLRTVPSDEDLAAVGSLIVRLAAFQAALEDVEPPPAEVVIVTRTGSPDLAAEGCTVCKQMEQALTRHLFSGQLRLASREDEQERHTRGGGFCPLHTWQYAAVASPLGISAGYAKLAASVAAALESLSRQDSTAADLARGVAALTTEPERCPVCAALTASERTAIAGLIAQIPPTTAALCLRHLALALSAGVEDRTARALLNALAATLRRDSEDMRAFALKREAYRSGLVTAEESRAHLDALRRLAGPPALAHPWTDQESARAWS